MSERGIQVSEIVAQLVTDARRLEGLSIDELADRAGVHRTYVGLVERRSRQPTLAVAASLAEALGLSLSELVAEAEHDAGNGHAPEVELVPAPPKRKPDRAHAGACPLLEATTGLTGGTVVRAVEIAYRKLDLIDEQMRASGSRPIAGLVDLPDLTELVGDVLGAGLARASNGLYVQNGSEHSPPLQPLQHGLPELQLAAALETDRPAGPTETAGTCLVFRYVLADRSGAFTRGQDSRGDTVAVWEIRFGALGQEDFHVTGTRAGARTARLRRDALDRMELVYYDTALLPYAKATGDYARTVRT
jgi:transcriptional regulator with XRE-family HTH domain